MTKNCKRRCDSYAWDSKTHGKKLLDDTGITWAQIHTSDCHHPSCREYEAWVVEHNRRKAGTAHGK